MPTMYLVTEIKTVPYEGAYALLTDTWQFANRNNAEAQYHARLSAAARSEYVRHAVIMTTNEGFPLESKFYAHEPEPEPEPTPEPEPEPETPSDATEGEDGTNAQGGESDGSDGGTDSEGA